MRAKTVSQHVAEVMSQIDSVAKLTADQRIQGTEILYGLFKAIQRGEYILDPLFPDTDLVTATVVKYRRLLEPADVLDDPPFPYPVGAKQNFVA